MTISGLPTPTKPVQLYLCAAWRLFLTLVEEKFAEGIGHWTYAVTAQPMPDNWRDLLLDELADWEDRGVLVMPGSLQVLHDWVSAVARVRGALPRDPNVVYPEDAWPRFIYPAPNPPTHSTGPSDVTRATLAAIAAAQHVTSLGRRASDADGAPVDISQTVTRRDLLQALVIYRSSLNIRALKILVLARDSGPMREIFISADLLRAFLQLWQIDRQTIMDAATAGRAVDAQASITRGVAAKAAAATPQPSPAQPNSVDAKLAPSAELPYNQKRSPAAPASPQPIALAAGDAERHRQAGNGGANGTDPSGEAIKILRQNIPGSYPAYGTTIDTYIANPPSLQQLQAKYGNNIQLLDLTGEEAKYAAMVAGDKKAEASLAAVFNAIKKTSAFPPLPVLGNLWPETFGNHCIRWMGNFLDNTKDLLKSGVFTLDVPLAGGPNHQIIIYKLPGGLMGVDNGFFGQMDGGNNDHLFDPGSVADNTSLPKITRCQVKAAVDKMNGGDGSQCRCED